MQRRMICFAKTGMAASCAMTDFLARFLGYRVGKDLAAAGG